MGTLFAMDLASAERRAALRQAIEQGFRSVIAAEAEVADTVAYLTRAEALLLRLLAEAPIEGQDPAAERGRLRGELGSAIADATARLCWELAIEGPRE